MTVYNLPAPVSVTPNNGLATSLADSITSNDVASPLLVELNSGNLNVVSKNVIALATVFNIQSSSPAVNSSQTAQINDQMATLREFLVDKVTELSVSDISSIKVISSALSAATQSQAQVSSKTAVSILYQKIYTF